MSVCTHLYMLCLMSLYYGIPISFRCCSAEISSCFLFSFSMDLWLLKSHGDQFISVLSEIYFRGRFLSILDTVFYLLSDRPFRNMFTHTRTHDNRKNSFVKRKFSRGGEDKGK